MANARSRFETICEYLVRNHDSVATGRVYGYPCAMQQGHAFIAMVSEDLMAFKLHGRVRLQALALIGAKFWDPLNRTDEHGMDWVKVPAEHLLRWDRLALEAYRCSKETNVGAARVASAVANSQAAVKEGRTLAQPPKAASRWSPSFILNAIAKAAGLSLSR
jgi:hypothetical protein